MSASNLDGVLWADASLTGLALDYERLVITLMETTGRRVRVFCDGYIGVALEGFWDETVVESASLVPAHPFGERCQRLIDERHGGTPIETGSPARNAGEFSTLVLTLVDGIDVLCCAARFRVEANDNPS